MSYQKTIFPEAQKNDWISISKNIRVYSEIPKEMNEIFSMKFGVSESIHLGRKVQSQFRMGKPFGFVKVFVTKKT